MSSSLIICRSPTKFIGGFLEDGLGTETINNSDAYKMLRRKSKPSNNSYYQILHKHVYVFLYRKSASATGLKTRKSNSLLAMISISPSTSPAQFPSLILLSEK
jgi:hypothetical protein